MNTNELKQEFIKLYGGDESDVRVFHSPGRVNLIGEHTDYNGGFVFPASLSLGTTIALRKTDAKVIRMKATDLPDLIEIDTENLDNYRELWWGNYQAGVMVELKKKGYDIIGCDMLFDDTLPHGGGLSSSAAIEVSTALALATLSNEKNNKGEVDMVEMAFIGQSAEHNYCNVNCGIMDQFASSMGKKDNAIFLNCNTMDFELVPLVLGDYKLVITNTNKKHSLATSKYNERRSECEQGLKDLQKAMPEKKCLGEISLDEFNAHKDLIANDIVRNRVAHVIAEDDRVLRSVEALKTNDLVEFGKLLNQSHDSLRDLYEVTGIELDTLVEEARKINGVLGSRMTGAGFGGSTVSIVKNDAVEEFMKSVEKGYTEKIGYAPSFIVDDIGNGGCEIK